MKTNIFSFNRLGLLFQRFFIERSRTELIYWSIMVMVFMLLRNNAPAMAVLILIGGVIYAARFFKEIHHSGNGVAYYMIPATQLEKLTVGVVITSFYYFAMMMITYSLGNLLGTFFNNILADMNLNEILGFSLFHNSPLKWNLFTNLVETSIKANNHSIILFPIFVMFMLGQSIYLLGSIYFKRNQFLATALSTSIIQFLLSILLTTELLLVFGSFGSVSGSYDLGNTIGRMLENHEYAENIFNIIIWLLPPFFWLVSYFRLTEKQV